MMIQQAISKITRFQNLSENDMANVMMEIMSGRATHAQIAGFLIGMQMKGATVSEIIGAAKVMRRLADKVTISTPLKPVIDIVGTGGDSANIFNISTTCAFVVAGGGAIVAKHGNRSVSSHCGSADVLEAAGVNINLTVEQVQRCIEQIGIGFLFAPVFHGAMKHALIPRKELGLRTLFNLLGPLTNPANAPFLMVGVYDKKWVTILAEVLLGLGCQRALVMHSRDGLDEISIAADTFIAELNEATIKTYEITPSQFGLSLQSLDSLKVENAHQSLMLMEDVLNNTQGPAKDIILLNAGAALFVAGLSTDIVAGVEKAREIIASGKALEKFRELINFSHNKVGYGK